jgi:putative FmdB family regulatory protein
MAIYEYYCPTCRERFEERRSMSQVAVAAACPQGHPAEKLLSSFAAVRAGGESEPSMEMGAGGCCGGAGGCACANRN